MTIRKYKKIWDHHYEKWNYKKAIESYKRYVKIIDNNEVRFLDIACCYTNIWEHEKALVYINKWLDLSSGYYKLIKLKWNVLEDLWRKKEAKVYIDKIKEIDKKCWKVKLDIDNFYSGKLNCE